MPGAKVIWAGAQLKILQDYVLKERPLQRAPLLQSKRGCALTSLRPFAMAWMELGGIILSKISQSERQLSYDLTLMLNIKNSTKDRRGREGKLYGRKSERETNYVRLLTLGNKLKVAGGDVGEEMG